jgi:6-hydroxycyclohex-1-ene-1-carbonyl-CoA dehydrogenase
LVKRRDVIPERLDGRTAREGDVSTDRNPYGFRLIAPGQPLERWEMPPPEPAPDQVVVEVAGCGVCHTDVSFAVDGVPTRHPLPLVLGHEISGRVVAAGGEAEAWVDRSVIVPAVVPCGGCDACAAGRPTICRRQFMPGNHGDGGFATHVTVPAHGLCQVPDVLPDGLSLPLLSVVADAVTTPLEAIARAGLTGDDVAVFVGVGGVGGFGVQIAAARGAAVVAIDVDGSRLELASAHGAALALDAGELDVRELRSAVRQFARGADRAGIGLKIFETSGTTAGQRTAWALLGPGAHLAVVGFTPEKLELRLSNLMAFDATAEGNWGSSPERYPEALDLVLDGKVALAPYVEIHPLERAPEVLQAVAEHRLAGRAILVPGAEGQGKEEP